MDEWIRCWLPDSEVGGSSPLTAWEGWFSFLKILATGATRALRGPNTYTGNAARYTSVYRCYTVCGGLIPPIYTTLNLHTQVREGLVARCLCLATTASRRDGWGPPVGGEPSARAIYPI